MGRQFFSLIVFVFTPCLLFSQQIEISGKIRNGNDESGIPFAVILHNEKPAAYSNENGDFRFYLEFQPNDKISVHVLGYEPWIKTLNKVECKPNRTRYNFSKTKFGTNSGNCDLSSK
jgi:hypothetical protein